MTRQEVTGKRPLDFSQWVRKSLPDSSTGFSASDIDFILWNWKTKKVMLLEIKTRNGDLRKGQRMMFELLHKWLTIGVNGRWKYCGFHLVQFEKTTFEDGRTYFDRNEVTEQELIIQLSL